MPITVSGGEIYTNCLVGENKVGIVTAKKRAEYEFLLYDRIPAGEVLWLRNYSERPGRAAFYRRTGRKCRQVRPKIYPLARQQIVNNN